MNSAVDALALLRTLASAAVEEPTLESGLQRVSDAILEATGWPYAEVWAPAGDDEVLECLYASPGTTPELARFRRRAHDLAFRRGYGLPGRVWATLQPIWHPDVTVLPPDEFARCHEAADAGLEAGLGVPIMDRDRLLAVLAFFVPLATEADWDYAETIGIVAAQLGAFFGQSRLEQQLSAVRERLTDAENRLSAVRQVVGTAHPTNRQKLLDALASLARADLDADHAAVLALGAEGAVTEHAYAGSDRRGIDRLREVIESSSVPGEILERERPLRMTAGEAGSDLPHVPGIPPGAGSILVAPVRTDGELSALICASRELGKPPFSRQDEARAEDLALQMTVGLARVAALDIRARASALEGRLRIMTEIQDDIIQNLFGLGLQLDTLAAIEASGETAMAIASGVERVNDLIAEARRYLDVVAGSEPIHDADLARGLASLLHKRLPAGTSAVLHIHADDLPALDRQAIGNLLLIAREAFDNAAEHAEASRVAVSLRRSSPGFELVIQDDGVGFDERSTPRGAGIAAMAAAAARIGAALTVFSIPGMGTTVHVTFAEP